MSDLRYIEQDGHDGPLCPNITTDPRHQLVVKIQNAMYEVMDRDEDGESPPEQYRVYAAAGKAASEYMRLYLATCPGLGSVSSVLKHLQQLANLEWSGSYAVREEARDAIKALCLPFADHPDFDERWKP